MIDDPINFQGCCLSLPDRDIDKNLPTNTMWLLKDTRFRYSILSVRNYVINVGVNSSSMICCIKYVL